jgi:hypothetical protein
MRSLFPAVALALTLMAGQAAPARSDPAAPATGHGVVWALRDADYVRGTSFFLFDPNVIPSWVPPSVASDPDFGGIEIPDYSIEVYKDDFDYSNDFNTIRGKALLEPERRGNSPVDSSAVRGQFNLLEPGADRDYEILRNVYGPLYKVLRLTQALSFPQILAVSYQARAVRRDGTPLTGYVNIGGQIEHDSIGGTVGPDDAMALRLKLIRPGEGWYRPDPSGPGFDPAHVFNAARELELRNFYQLPEPPIDPANFRLVIRRGVDEPPITSIPQPGGSAVPYLEAVGLDNLDESGGQPVPGHDGKVDGASLNPSTGPFVDFEKATFFLPDPRPFAPRLAGPDAKPFERAVSRMLSRRDSLVGPPDSANGANPAIYDHFTVDRATDTRYWIEASWGTATVFPVPPPSRLGVTAWPNPVRDAVSLGLSFPRAEAAEIELFDLRGRRLAQRALPGAAAGFQVETLDETRAYPPGLYFVRVRQGSDVQSLRICLVR